jgi:urease accessory protein
MPAAAPWRRRKDTTFAAMFALACMAWHVPREAALNTFAWIWVETQILAAVKLVPLGQMAGQRLLSHCVAQIPGWITQALLLEDDDIGIATVMQGMASARHESQYTRLFRS